MLPIHTILHPTDFSPFSASSFQVACALARDYGARLILVHVREQQPVAAFGEYGAIVPDPVQPLHELQATLDALKPADASFPVETCLVDGDAAQEVVRLARDRHCDLIVMGTHGRTGLGRFLMGSVAELVVRKTACPVLTVKMPEGEAAAILAGLDEPALA
jgi:nucleotide-binding universal stress UspA family protein